MVDGDSDLSTLASSLGDDDALAEALRDAMHLKQEATLRQALTQAAAGEYEILETLGRGASGVVFKARDLKNNRIVAIKCLLQRDGRDLLPAAMQEARHLARIAHPNIAAIHAVEPYSQAPAIVMEFVDGRPITDALAGRPLIEQIDAFKQALRATAELHHRGLIHRDLKPANILVDAHGAVKLVDFGIAHTAGGDPTTHIRGTPAYLSPEQSAGLPPDPTADVFSLGVILFELLTGQRPFEGHTTAETIRAIRENDPPLPRSLREEIPGALQAICLAALEKDPARRYPSAVHFLLDLDRFTHDEPISADPTLLASILEHGIDRHVSNLRRWRSDRLISTHEFDYFLDRYDRLRQREEFWVLDSRRISFSQVILHLGVWACVVSAFLMLAFPWPALGAARAALPGSLLAGMLIGGASLWRRRTRRVAIVLLIGAAITSAITIATTLAQFHLFARIDPNNELLEQILTNRQFLAATAGALVLGVLLWWQTKTAAFSLICGIALIAVATAIFGIFGLRHELETGRADLVAGWYLAPAAVLLLSAMIWDLRFRLPSFAAPLYVMGLVLLILSLTLIALTGPTLRWLGLIAPPEGAELTRQIQYSFMVNGVGYLLVGIFAGRSGRSAWLRRIGTFMFWLAPSHILIPVLRLENEWTIFGSHWTAAELLLPIGALAFVFASVPKQMKSFFFSGLFYLAVSVQRLTSRHFQDQFAWPITLALVGAALALLAWLNPSLFDKHRTLDRSRKSEMTPP